MKRRSAACVLLTVCAAACARPLPRARTGAQDSVRTVAVFPPNNRTGDPLLIAGASFLEKYVLPTERFTVPDALAATARVRLSRSGFDVVAPELVDAATRGQAPSSPQAAAAVAVRDHLEGAVLYIEVRRWEADVPFHPTFVIASVSVVLIDPSSGRILWTADHPSRPLQTAGVINLGDAYAIAARAVMEELLAGLRPAGVAE